MRVLVLGSGVIGTASAYYLARQGFDLSKYRVIYRDTRGIWDQLLVDRTGHFAGFSSVNERDLSAALARLTRH